MSAIEGFCAVHVEMADFGKEVVDLTAKIQITIEELGA